MKTTLNILIFFMLIVTFGSCTIQKRTFNKGYHIEWNRKFKKSETQPGKQEGNDDLIQRDAENSSGEDNAIEETQTTVNTIEYPIEPSEIDSAKALVDVSKMNHTEQNQSVSLPQKKLNSSESAQKNFYGGSRRGIGAIVFIVVFGLIFLLVYLAFTSGSYVGGFLLLIAAGYLLITIFVVLFILLLVRLFLGAFRY